MSTRERHGNWIQTITGRAWWPIDPHPEDVDIADIAHALSMLCRYGGHCKAFYSVAEHSVLVSRCVPPEHALIALMHDATEAYLVDVPRPIKQHLANYKELEHLAWVAIADRFGLPYELPACVHEADNAVLLAERAVLKGPSPGQWNVPGKPAKVVIECLPPEVARWRFLERFHQLTRCATASSGTKAGEDANKRTNK